MAAADAAANTRQSIASRPAAAVVLRTRDGRTLTGEADVGIPSADPQAQWHKLVAKAQSIAAPVIGAARLAKVVEAVEGLDSAGSIRPLMKLLA